ncbi:MAG: glycosyltransferase family 2 protein [Sulfurimicrobium sp.]|nr:glycosyltransferase family 2 protein [Sulfurimicrobium sp.]MDP1703629.1 glycosyltransferase family 2 protein [Sulfurimicrobium sp.]MDP2199503.1 glycosyltransferase family 2 protein [Sulfurimicrobium sp.]MDP2961256.1 glycosyltransferase family 2 protein [Sulfurimicrobium sp.]MDP3687185.1 glycosyltransferase family 2 protein [Sulfurimicrobium sp.]
MNIAVVIPAYNEARTIREVVEQALQQCPQVIVVDDGSQDGTAQQLDGLPVTLLRNPVNLGKAASLWRGMQAALKLGVAGVMTLDGDGQHDPRDIPRLLAVAEKYPAHVVIGSRLHEKVNIPRRRYLANRFANFWIAWAAGYPIADSQSGFRYYPAELLRRVSLQHEPRHSFVFESEILIEGGRRGIRSVATPIAAIYRDNARPSHFRPVLDIVRITRMVAWKLFKRGMFPLGLYRSLSGKALIVE